jgi:hypothetical protein
VTAAAAAAPATVVAAPVVVAAPFLPPALPAISLRKTERLGDVGPFVTNLSASAGKTVSYRMVVTNTGAITVAVSLVDMRCDDGTLIAHGSTTLAPGATVEYTCTHALVVVDGPVLVNTATAVGTTAAGANSPTATGRAVVHLVVLTRRVVKRVTKHAAPAIAVKAAATFTG